MIKKYGDFEVDVLDANGRTYTYTVRGVQTSMAAVKKALRLHGPSATWAGNVRPYTSVGEGRSAEAGLHERLPERASFTPLSVPGGYGLHVSSITGGSVWWYLIGPDREVVGGIRSTPGFWEDAKREAEWIVSNKAWSRGLWVAPESGTAEGRYQVPPEPPRHFVAPRDRTVAAVSDTKQQAAFRRLDHFFGSPSAQQRGFPSEDAAAHSAATLLAGQMKLKYGTAIELVREWYRRGSHGVGEGHAVADFNTLDDLIAHARDELGATHVGYPEPGTMQGVVLFFPRKDGQYEAASVSQRSGYWHTQGPGSREIMRHLPRGAQSIGGRGARRTVEAGRLTRWPDWMILESVEEGLRMSPEATDRAYELVELGYIDATGTWKLTPKGQHALKRRVDHVHEAKATEARTAEARRSPRGSLSHNQVMTIAGDLSKKVRGTAPKSVVVAGEPGARFMTYSPEHGQPVVVFLSTVDDSNIALDIYSDESTTNRYENIGTFLYGPGGYTSKSVNMNDMVETVEWVWATVDGYAASWQEGEGGGLDEAPRRSAHRPPERAQGARRRARRAR